MRFHVPGVPHTVTNKRFLSCAYTQKVVKLCEMLINLGHTVYHYGCEGSDPKCTEHISIVTDEYRQKYYPDKFHTEQFRFDTADEFHQNFHKRCVEEIKKRMQPKDFLLCAWGWGHQPTAIQLPELMVVESGIGYPDVFSKYKVFESYTWMQYVYGKEKIGDGSWYDCVIPNYFDVRDFQYNDKKEDWFLYIGRIVKRKGVELAAQVCEKMGKKLIIAGQGKITDPNENIDLNLPHVEHVGFADVNKRKDLMSRAKGVFVPTYYVEPFGGVAIESQLSGTPVISTDWGVFSETILQGVTGYRCRTFDQFCWAVENIDKCSPKACHEWAKTNYSMERVALMYQEYFEMLYDLWGEGWYARHPNRTNLDWNRRWFPIEATLSNQIVAASSVITAVTTSAVENAPSPDAPINSATLKNKVTLRNKRDWME